MPNRLDSLRWILLVGFAVLFALGVLMVWRKPIPALEASGAATTLPASRPGTGPRAGRKSASSTSPVGHAHASAPVRAAERAEVIASESAVAIASEPAAAMASSIDREVEHSLDGLKDRLFRLELRRQAGTISEEEYARERSRAEEILRELVRG